MSRYWPYSESQKSHWYVIFHRDPTWPHLIIIIIIIILYSYIALHQNMFWRFTIVDSWIFIQFICHSHKHHTTAFSWPEYNLIHTYLHTQRSLTFLFWRPWCGSNPFPELGDQRFNHYASTLACYLQMSCQLLQCNRLVENKLRCGLVAWTGGVDWWRGLVAWTGGDRAVNPAWWWPGNVILFMWCRNIRIVQTLCFVAFSSCKTDDTVINQYINLSISWLSICK